MVAMVLYTPLALEDVLASPDSQAGEPWLTHVGGRPCLVRRGPSGQVVMERLLSTDPADFLDARFQPGCPLT